jgi:hypothetical protein
MERFLEPIWPQYFEDEPTEPVPGWGVNPLWAGPRMIAVGADPSLVATAEGQATDLYHAVTTEAKANPLYYIGAAAAAGLLGFAMAPRGKLLVGGIAAALGLVGVHFLLGKTAISKPGLVATGTPLPVVDTTTGSQQLTAAAPTAEVTKTVTAAAPDGTPSADTAKAIAPAPPPPPPASAPLTMTPAQAAAAGMARGAAMAAAQSSCQEMVSLNPMTSMDACLKQSADQAAPDPATATIIAPAPTGANVQSVAPADLYVAPGHLPPLPSPTHVVPRLPH